MRRGAFLGWQMMVLLGLIKVAVAAGPADVLADNSSVRGKVAAAIVRAMPSSAAALQDAANLGVLDPLLTLPSHAELRVTSVRSGYDAKSRLVRLECASPRDCLPFHVVVRGTGFDPGKSTGKAEPNPAGTKSPVARSGDYVLLVEERSGMRLKVTAVCLQSGAVGDHIRVRNLATQRILVAMIAGKNLVRVE